MTQLGLPETEADRPCVKSAAHKTCKNHSTPAAVHSGKCTRLDAKSSAAAFIEVSTHSNHTSNNSYMTLLIIIIIIIIITTTIIIIIIITVIVIIIVIIIMIMEIYAAPKLSKYIQHYALTMSNHSPMKLMNTRIRIHTHTHLHTCNTYTQYTHTLTPHICTHACTHVHARAHTHIYTHTHTHTQARRNK